MHHIYLAIFALIGFVVSYYLYYSKTHNKNIHCLIGHDCDAVVKSKYGETFGIENTLVGLLYYGLIFAYALLILNRNVFKADFIYYFIVSISFLSVIFSVYLTAIQAFVLKKWCDYCIISAIVSALILLMLLVM